MDVKELVTCILCMEIYDENLRVPRMLQCGHSFCSSCIEKFLRNLPNCPLCKSFIQENDMKFISINYSLKELVEQYTLESERTALANLKKSRTSISTFNKTCFQSEGFCVKHKIDKRFHCVDCVVWICGDCATMDHKNCEIIVVAEAIRVMKEEKIEKIENHLETLIPKCEYDFLSILDQYKRILKNNEEELKCYENRASEVREKILKDNRSIQIVEKFMKKLPDINTNFKYLIKPINNADNAKALNTIEHKLTKNTKDFENVLQTLMHHKTSLIEQKNECEKRDSVLRKQWLLPQILLEKKVFISTSNEDSEVQYGELEMKEEKIWIYSMFQCHPPPSSVCLTLDQFFAAFTGKQIWPRKVFLELAVYGVLLGQVIVRLSDEVEASKAFLYTCLGYNVPSSFKGTELRISKSVPYLYSIACFSVPVDVDSRLMLLEKRRCRRFLWRRGEIACKILQRNPGLLFCFYIMVEDVCVQRDWISVGQVAEGMETIKQVSELAKSGSELGVMDCGWILD